MMHKYFFEYSRIILKPLEFSDIDDLRVLRNKEAEYFLNTSKITAEMQERWFEKYLTKEDDIMFKIVLRDHPDVFVGAISIYDINMKLGTAEVGRTIVDKEKAPIKGIGTEATKAICKFGFEVLKIKKIIGIALKTNERILKVDQRVGFKIIGDYNDTSYLMEITASDLNEN